MSVHLGPEYARKGKHEGLISFDTFEKIQARLKSTAKAPARKDTVVWTLLLDSKLSTKMV